MTEYEAHTRIEKLEADVASLRALVDGILDREIVTEREPGEEG